ncbi:MAG: hypothetical protein SGPRY_011223, partial [Prymnesium sp.]
MAAYTWLQDNSSVTLELSLPCATRPSQLRLLLSRRRLTLLHAADASVFLRRRFYAHIEPRCTDCYTMPLVGEEGPAVVRVVLLKALPAGWLYLFRGDAPNQGFVFSPAPMSHSMARLAAQAKARSAAAEDARKTGETAQTLSCSAPSQQSWRARGRMEGPLVRKAGGLAGCRTFHFISGVLLHLPSYL